MELFFNSYILQIMTVCCINIIVVLGLNLITGVTGQLSLGHAAFCSIGAYTATILMMKAGLPFWLVLPLGAISAGVVAALFSLPILRLRGDYLAIATLGFCEIVRVVFLNMKITGGALGISGIPNNTNVNIALILALFAIVFMYNIENSRFGLALRSIREDEIAAEMMGINISGYKVLAFAIGSAFAGLGGVLYASQITFISPGDFGFMHSVVFLSMLVLGGMGSIPGVVFGVIMLTVVPEGLRFAPEQRMIMYGVVLIMIMAFRPQGLLGKIKVNL